MARILVADHDEDALARTAQRLERAGYEVVLARDGEEALARARDARPDVCVLDAMTPKLTGYDVVRGLRQDARTRGCRVILVTALGAGAATSGADGVDAYVRKPCSPHELRARVGAVLARTPRDGAARPAAS